MRLWTSYYGNIRNIPKDWFLVSASRNITDEILMNVDIQEQHLAPSESIFYEYKQDRDWEKYIKRFKAEKLPEIDWLEHLEQWEELANKNGKDISNIVLLCYEAADSGDGKGQFCHRHILAENFEEHFKCDVKEFGFENMIRESDYKLTIENNTDILF